GKTASRQSTGDSGRSTLRVQDQDGRAGYAARPECPDRASTSRRILDGLRGALAAAANVYISERTSGQQDHDNPVHEVTSFKVALTYRNRDAPARGIRRPTPISCMRLQFPPRVTSRWCAEPCVAHAAT